MKFRIAACFLSLLLVAACLKQPQVAAEKEKQPRLKIRTEANGQVFIEPALKQQNNVFIKLSDTTAQAKLRLSQHIREALSGKGYRVVGEPEKANYIIQGNVVESGEVSAELLQKAYVSPFGAKFRELQTGKTDPVANAVGYLFRKAKGKNYVIIVDFQLTQKRKIASSRQKTEFSRCRVITGTKGCHAPIDEAMSQLRENFKSHLVAYF